MFEKNYIWKHFSIFTLVVIITLGLVINYVHSDFIAHGSDEFAYMGLSQQTVVFDNREPSLYPPDTNPHLIPYSLGMLGQLTGLQIHTVFRLIHGIVIVLTIIGFYVFLSRFSKSTGLLGALLVALYPTASSGLGLATLVPSTLILLALPYIFVHFLEKQYLTVGFWLGFVFLFYWWAFIPLLLCFFVYYLLQRKQNIVIVIFSVLFVAASHIIFLRLLHFDGVFKPFPFADFFGITRTPFWEDASLDFILEKASIYIPLIVLFVCLPPIYKKTKDKRIIHIALSLLIVNLMLFFVSQAAQSRTIYFLYSGLFILLSIVFSRFHFGKYFKTVLFSLFFVMTIIGTDRQLSKDFLYHPQTNRSEIELFQWLAQHASHDSVIISDYHTMQTSLLFVNNKTAKMFSDDLLADGDLKRITKILDKGALEGVDREYLISLQNALGARELYVVITGRTRSLMEYYTNTGEYTHSRVLNKEYYRSAVFIGEEKFKEAPFSVVYSELDEASQKDFSVYQLMQ